MNQLSITKDKVLEAASKCETAKATLRVLFPEAFEDRYVKLRSESIRSWDGQDMVFAADDSAPDGLRWKCLALSSEYDWTIADGNSGNKVLIPTKKKA